jgi:hypothetical protein
MGVLRKSYKILIVKPESKRSRLRWKDNIKMNFKEIELVIAE